ncbi:hypothetical protein, partial [Cobetia sp. 29-18-1]|uniref:hypothetical protein n=1 Tax=Cobetia sp. 29-18-1 TaxID=3040018 RepID=UPI00244A5AFF
TPSVAIRHQRQDLCSVSLDEYNCKADEESGVQISSKYISLVAKLEGQIKELEQLKQKLRGGA